MKKLVGKVGVLGGMVLLSACGTTRTFVDYSRTGLYSTETVGNVPYVEVGSAAASERGFFWEGCEALAQEAVSKLRATAEQRGASNVIGVRWLNHADGTYAETPTCTTGWGWFTAAVVGGFMPWVKATELEGQLVYVEDSSLARLRGEVDRRSAAWQAREARVVAEMEASETDRVTAEAAIAARDAEAAAAQAAAEKAAAERAAAEKAAAAQRAAAERAAAERAAAASATESKPPVRRKTKAKAAAPSGAGASGAGAN